MILSYFVFLLFSFYPPEFPFPLFILIVLYIIRPLGGNDICLEMHPGSGKHPKQIRSNTNNWIILPIGPSNGTAKQNVRVV